MVATWKKEAVKDLEKKIRDYPVVGIVKIEGIPSKQMQEIRKTLDENTELIVTRNSLIELALKTNKLDSLNDHIEGPTGLILSKTNPFKLQSGFSEKSIKAPAKAGNIAPMDISIPAGPTSLAAGPVIGEIQGAGIKAKIEGGKIVVKESSTVAKEGERIPAEVATVLLKLGIEPMTIGLNLTAASEGGVVYTQDILTIDKNATISQIKSAHAHALSLAYNSEIYNSDTIKLFLTNAASAAMNFAINAEIVNKETIGFFLAKTSGNAAALSLKIGDLPSSDEGKKEEKSGEPAEEKSEDESKSDKGPEKKEPDGSQKESDDSPKVTDDPSKEADKKDPKKAEEKKESEGKSEDPKE